MIEKMVTIVWFNEYYDLDEETSKSYNNGYNHIIGIKHSEIYPDFYIIELQNQYGYSYSGRCSKLLEKEELYISKETIILKKLAEVYSLFTELKSQHPDELNDFVDGIHKLQYVLGMRIARKDHPNLFPTKE